VAESVSANFDVYYVPHWLPRARECWERGLSDRKSMTSTLEVCERFGRATGIVDGSLCVNKWYQRSTDPRTVYQTVTTGTSHHDLNPVPTHVRYRVTHTDPILSIKLSGVLRYLPHEIVFGCILAC
jgi:hypothetical protein